MEDGGRRVDRLWALGMGNGQWATGIASNKLQDTTTYHAGATRVNEMASGRRRRIQDTG